MSCASSNPPRYQTADVFGTEMHGALQRASPCRGREGPRAPASCSGPRRPQRRRQAPPPLSELASDVDDTCGEPVVECVSNFVCGILDDAVDDVEDDDCVRLVDVEGDFLLEDICQDTEEVTAHMCWAEDELTDIETDSEIADDCEGEMNSWVVSKTLTDVFLQAAGVLPPPTSLIPAKEATLSLVVNMGLPECERARTVGDDDSFEEEVLDFDSDDDFERDRAQEAMFYVNAVVERPQMGVDVATLNMGCTKVEERCSSTQDADDSFAGDILDFGSDDEDEELERDCAEDAASYVEEAMALARVHVEELKREAWCFAPAEEGEHEESAVEDEAPCDVIGEAPTCDELTFDFINEVIDESISEGLAEITAGAQELPSSASIAPCMHRGFSRAYCPQDRTPVPAEAFPSDCLPSQPAFVAPPVVLADWSVILREVLRADDSASSKATAANGSPRKRVEKRSQSSTIHDCEQATAFAEIEMPAKPTRSLQYSRSKRRIIGGVIRAAIKSEELSGKSSMPVVQVNIDDDGGLSDASAGGSHASKLPGSRNAARDSSLVRGYNALGKVQFHRLDMQDDLLQPAGSPLAKVSSKAPSAMSLDLGLPFESSSPLASPPRRLTTSQSAADLCQKSVGRSMVTKSNGSLSNETSFLPALQRTSSGSIAWSVHRARASARRERLAAVM